MTLRDINWGEWYRRIDGSVTHLEHAYSPSRFLDVLRADVPRGKSVRVLELGCAPGRWLAWTISRLGVQGFGIELDGEGVRVSRQLFPTLQVTRADAFALPFPTEHFDVVYSIGLIEHFQDPSGILREAHRVLRRRGTSIWLVPNLEAGSLSRWHWRRFHRENFEAHRSFTLQELERLVEATGFVVQRSEYSGLYIPHLQRILGRLPLRSLLRRLEGLRTAANLVVAGVRVESTQP